MSEARRSTRLIGRARTSGELWLILATTLAANVLVVAGLQWPAVLGAALLLFVLPGWTAISWLVHEIRNPAGSDALHRWLDRIVLCVGLSIVCTTLTGLAVHYLPGPVSRAHILVACDGTIGVLAALAWWRRRRVSQVAVPTIQSQVSSRTLLAVLLTILVLAAAYRFVNLGYAELQGDEALVTWSAARSLVGESDVLFLHGKSPAEIILPADLWALTGWLNEWVARFPFALVGWTAVLAAYLLALRLRGPRTGAIAVFLFAVCGYFVGFSRVVQYQSLVMLMSVLAVYTAYRALEDRADVFQFFSALFLGVGLLAHFDALLVVPVVLWLWYLRFREGGSSTGQRWHSAGLAVVFLVLPVAAFYIPLSRDVQFAQMLSYLGGSRVGTNVLNNHVAFFLISGTIYNASYYTALLVLGFLCALWGALRRLPRGTILATLLTVLMLATVYQPDRWQAGRVNLAIVPYAVAILLAWLSPASGRAIRVVWLWLGATMLPYLFVLALPLSHIYVIMPPLLLLTASALDPVVAWMTGLVKQRRAAAIAIYPALAVIAVVLACYPYLVFVRHTPEFTETYRDKPVSLYWRPVNPLPQVGLFGFPHKSGWKAVGEAYATGTLSGDFATNEEEWVALWYTHFAPTSCTPDAQHYFIAANPWDAVPVPQEIIAEGYVRTAVITVDGTPRLSIYTAKSEMAADAAAVQEIAVSAVEAAFDRDTAPARFVQNSTPAQEMRVNFGDQITLLGYDLFDATPHDAPLTPGESLPLTLYWSTQAPLTQDYHVFVQLGEGELWGQADGVPVCNRLATALWRPGQIVIDRHRLDTRPDTPAGQHPLRVGLYAPDTGIRLVPQEHNAGDDSVILTDIAMQ